MANEGPDPGMDGRQRLRAALEHRQPDRVCVDFGATFITGIHVSALTRLRHAVLGPGGPPIKVIEPYQMLGEVDDELRSALGIDTVGGTPRTSMFGTESKDWKPFTMNDGTPVLVPGQFNVTRDEAGDTYMYPEGDTSIPPSGRMPAGGYFFDALIRQPTIDEERLDPADNCQEFGLLEAVDLDHFRRVQRAFADRPALGHVLVLPGTAFGDIALVPAPFLKHPRGIRDIEEWYVSTVIRKDYVLEVFRRQCEIAERNVAALIELFGDTVDVAVVTGTDFGTQRGPFISNQAYRELYQPFQRRINDLIHARSRWKTFIHSCGSVYQLIPDFIEAGFDILNPVQCSAAEMDAPRLKREFGRDLVFWGGGVDTQQTIAFGSPREVYDEVRQRIEIFNRDGGFVFNTIHNVQGNTPTDNLLALFQALRDMG